MLYWLRTRTSILGRDPAGPLAPPGRPEPLLQQPKYKSHNADERNREVIELANDYRDKGVRLLYSQLIIGFSRLVRLMRTIWSRSHLPRTQHIHYLYLTPDSYLLPMHLDDFYPGLPPHKADKGPSARFHEDFNPTRLEEARSESVAFISAALQWKKGRRLFWNEHKCVTTPFFTVPASLNSYFIASLMIYSLHNTRSIYRSLKNLVGHLNRLTTQPQLSQHRKSM